MKLHIACYSTYSMTLRNAQK
uniref:Uncharacterized protein n=1 Tax=Rhizophora mucronata TaxID=61149 RepID=A0A2P2QGZ8_RHIMU